MPELPEVETTLRGISPHISNKKVLRIDFFIDKLRWPVPKSLSKELAGQTLKSLSRRSKYLIFEFESGSLLVHLGMSGSLKVIKGAAPERSKHDHVDLAFEDEITLRYHDPRRFGAWLWNKDAAHPQLQNLGPEPLTIDFNSDYLFSTCINRKRAIKNHIMDNQIVVGVGNIYATEALFQSQIHPSKPCHLLTIEQIQLLTQRIKDVLGRAIKQGGTTLKDFTQSDGKPGYFAQKLEVYGRYQEPCFRCDTLIDKVTLGQRTSAFCPNCQQL